MAGLQFAFGIRRTGQMCVPLEKELTWILWGKTGDKDGFTGVKVGWTTYKLDETNDVSVLWPTRTSSYG